MSYECVEFSITPPIEGDVGSIPDDIKLKKDGSGLSVIIGEDAENKIEESARFKELIAKGETIDDSLYKIVKERGIQKGQTYLNRLNTSLDYPKYELSGYWVVKSGPTGEKIRFVEAEFELVWSYETDIRMNISETYDEDTFHNKLYDYYNKGMKAQKEGNLDSAYKYFYDLLPHRKGSHHRITEEDTINTNLRIIRNGLSHDILTKIDMERAKTLLGDEYVIQDAETSKLYAYFDQSNPRS